MAVVGLALGVLKLSIRGGHDGWPRRRNSSRFNALRHGCDRVSVGPALGKSVWSHAPVALDNFRALCDGRVFEEVGVS